MGWGESNLRKSFGTIDFFVRCAHNCTFVTLAENEFHRYVGIEQRNCRKSFVKGWNGTHKYIYSTKTFSQTDENERVHFTPFFMGVPSRNGGSPSLLPLLWGVNFPLFFPNANRQPEPLYQLIWQWQSSGNEQTEYLLFCRVRNSIRLLCNAEEVGVNYDEIDNKKDFQLLHLEGQS